MTIAIIIILSFSIVIGIIGSFMDYRNGEKLSDVIKSAIFLTIIEILCLAFVILAIFGGGR